MEMDLTTAATIITVTSLVLGSIFGMIKHFKKDDTKEWKEPVEKVRRELESLKHNNQLRFAEFENKIQLLAIDAEKIADVKVWISRVEKSFSDETNKLEGKIDELMRMLIDLIKKGKD